MSSGIIKHTFAGGNTTSGFVSFYEEILSSEIANHIFCIKGGPGVGKSTFMKKVGTYFSDLGYDVEYVHCSSDPQSLDIVYLPQLKVMLLDGTSPHIIDPKNPGAVDEILNFGEYWDEEGIRKNREEIIKVNTKIKNCFMIAYQYLKSVRLLYDGIENLMKKSFKEKEYNYLRFDLINSIFTNIPLKDENGKARNLLTYAFTPEGISTYRESLINLAEKRIVIGETLGLSSEELFNDIVKEGVKRGYYIECYRSPIKLEKIEDIYIPDMKLVISVSNEYNPYPFPTDKTIDLTTILEDKILIEYKETIKELKDEMDILVKKGLYHLQKAKEYHDILEEFYIPNINHQEIDDLLPKIIAKIHRYAR
ncbi:MAG: ATPase [Bacilli bacterium]|nr:ATPase [Bacilli bacterium]